jgi:hypothetical protein
MLAEQRAVFAVEQPDGRTERGDTARAHLEDGLLGFKADPLSAR